MVFVRTNFVVVGVPVPVWVVEMLSVFALAPSYVPTGPMRAAVATRRAPNAAAIAVTRETADISTNAGTCVQVRHRRRPGRCPRIFCTFYDHPAPPPRPPPRNKRSPCPPPAPQWQAGEPSNEPSVSCWLDEAASEEASKDVWVCVHTHPCLDYEDDDKAPHAEDSW